MKKNYVLLLFLFSVISIAQPPGYYNSATGTGYALKTQLKNIIDDQSNGLSPEYLHISQGYNALDAFYGIADLDVYYENDGTILDIYSENPTGSDPYPFYFGQDECGNYSIEGDCFNKEHVIPQFIFSQNEPMRGDAHHVLPTDGKVNGLRSNYPFGIVGTLTNTSSANISNPTLNGSKLGNGINSGVALGYTGLVFEPIDEFKGDIARIYFYFVTRYEDNVAGWSAYDMFDGSSDKAIADPFLSILLQWHNNDPVSQKEIDRNNDCFTHQNNRNPFVDHPEWVAAIWAPTSDTTPPSVPTNLLVSNETSSSLVLSWSASTDDTAVANYDVYVDGVYYTTVTSPTCTITGLSSSTTYSFTVSANDPSGNNSGLSSPVSGTTLAPSTSVTELFFSEYMEGSSNNKALEIANYTGSNISLSIYTLKLATNGSTTWTSPIAFPSGAQVNDQDVYVITNSGLAVCTSASDYVNNSATAFNGNDVIGLFKNDVLIDIIGTLGNSVDFAKDITLVRKSTILGPNTTFDLNEWDTYATNTCSDLGNHTVLSNDNFNLIESLIYPNPSNTGNFNIVTHSILSKITVYNVNGQVIKELKNPLNTDNNYEIIGLNTGFYFILLQSETGSIIKKVIVN